MTGNWDKPGIHAYHFAFLAMVFLFAFYLRGYPSRFTPKEQTYSRTAIQDSETGLRDSSVATGAIWMMGG